MSETETITISSCPVCGGTHTYPIRTEPSYGSEVTKRGTASRRHRGLRTFTKFLMCPVKQIMFQAVIELQEGFELSA